MNKKKVFIIIAVPVVLLPLLLFLFQDRFLLRAPVLMQKDPLVTFSYGKVSYREFGEKEWQAVSVGLRIPVGSTVRTARKSLLDVRFHSGMSLRIAANSTVILNDSNIKDIRLSLEKGSLYGHFGRLYREQAISVETPTAVASVRGTELGFEIVDAPPEKFEKAKGEKTKEAAGDKEGKGPESAPTAVPGEQKPKTATIIYALSGIVEINNPRRPDDKILLSYQSKTLMLPDLPPPNPENIKGEEVKRLRNIMNSIHTEEVLLITEKIHFDFGRARITPDSHMELDRIARLISESGNLIRIEGHTDNIGSDYINRRLSLRRAQAIRYYLVKRGVNTGRLQTAGYGSTRSIADNRTSAGRAANRRVEFIIVR